MRQASDARLTHIFLLICNYGFYGLIFLNTKGRNTRHSGDPPNGTYQAREFFHSAVCG